MAVGLTIASLAMMLASVSAAIMLRGANRPAEPGVIALPAQAMRSVSIEPAPRSEPPVAGDGPVARHPPVTDYADDMSSCWGP